MRLKTLLLSAALCCTLLSACGPEEQAQAGVPDISVYQTGAQNIPIHQEFVGQVYGFKDIAIRARVEGYLEGIHFQEGSHVKQGDLLYSIESQPFVENVAAKQSQVAEARTMLVKANNDLQRVRPLAEQNALSQRDLDSATALQEASQAAVEAAEAILRAARIQLGYTKVQSPISGIIGKTRAKVGDFVGRSPNPIILNVVSRIDTVLVEFFITENQYLYLVRRARLLDDSYLDEDRPARLELVLADGSLYEHKGVVGFVDREVDPTTGALLIQASFPNPDEILRPGQFAKIIAEAAVIEDGIMIPQRCIMELQGLYRVYVVDAQNTVALREVRVGPTIRDFRVILEGLQAGEKVVYEGLQKVKPGAAVNPVIQDVQPLDSEEK
jgi:membrane fusion protein (multidrug efflux system)